MGATPAELEREHDDESSERRIVGEGGEGSEGEAGVGYGFTWKGRRVGDGSVVTAGGEDEHEADTGGEDKEPRRHEVTSCSVRRVRHEGFQSVRGEGSGHAASAGGSAFVAETAEAGA